MHDQVDIAIESYTSDLFGTWNIIQTDIGHGWVLEVTLKRDPHEPSKFTGTAWSQDKWPGDLAGQIIGNQFVMQIDWTNPYRWQKQGAYRNYGTFFSLDGRLVGNILDDQNRIVPWISACGFNPF